MTDLGPWRLPHSLARDNVDDPIVSVLADHQHNEKSERSLEDCEGVLRRFSVFLEERLGANHTGDEALLETLQDADRRVCMGWIGSLWGQY